MLAVPAVGGVSGGVFCGPERIDRCARTIWITCGASFYKPPTRSTTSDLHETSPE